MAVVIKFAVVGLLGFDAERIREAGVLEQYAVLRGKKSVVFSHPAIIVGFIPIYADIAEHYAKITGSFDNLIAPIFAVA